MGEIWGIILVIIYVYWCKNIKNCKSIEINSIIENGYEQLCKYIG